MFGHFGQRKDKQLRRGIQISSTNWPVCWYVEVFLECLKAKVFLLVAQSFHFAGQTNFCFHFSNQHFFCCFIYFYSAFSRTNNVRNSISLDINECSEGLDDCNRKTQLCLNTRGGYKCQEKIGDKCLPGLKYNIGTKLCEGWCRSFDWFSDFFMAY